MSDEMTFADVPAREDCPSCPETGERCALHQNMYLRALERQQEPDAMNQTQQAYAPERGGHDEQRVASKTMSKTKSKTLAKTLAKEKNRLKTQEGQMISVSSHSFSSCILHSHYLHVQNILFSRYSLFAGSEEDELRGE